MKKLTKFLLDSIIASSQKVKINQRGEGDLLTLEVLVPQEEIGKVIGKNGRTVKALTSLLRIKAIKEGKRVTLEVQEKKEKN